MCSALRGERSTRRCGFQRIARSEGGSACHDIRELQRSRGWRLGSPNCGTNNLPDDSSANCCSFDHPHRRAYTTNFRANEGSYGDRLHVLSNLCANYRSDRRTNDGGTNSCTVDGADFSALNFRTFDRSDFHTYEGADSDGVHCCSFDHPHRGAYTTNFRANEGTYGDRLHVLSNYRSDRRANDGGTDDCAVDGADCSAFDGADFSALNFRTYEDADSDKLHLRADDRPVDCADVCTDSCTYDEPYEHSHQGTDTTNFRTNEGSYA